MMGSNYKCHLIWLFPKYIRPHVCQCTKRKTPILPYLVGQQFVCLTSTLSAGVPLFRIFRVAPDFSRNASGIY